MSKRIVVALASLLAVGVCGWTFAQPGPTVFTPKVEAVGTYAVSTGGSRAIMIDTVTGKSWILYVAATGEKVVWLPLERYDDPVKVEKLMAQEKELMRQREIQQMQQQQLQQKK